MKRDCTDGFDLYRYRDFNSYDLNYEHRFPLSFDAVLNSIEQGFGRQNYIQPYCREHGGYFFSETSRLIYKFT